MTAPLLVRLALFWTLACAAPADASQVTSVDVETPVAIDLGLGRLRHDTPILDCAVSGDFLLSVSNAGDLGVWKAATGELVAQHLLGAPATAAAATSSGYWILLRDGRLAHLAEPTSEPTKMESGAGAVLALDDERQRIALLGSLTPLEIRGIDGSASRSIDIGRRIAVSAHFDATGSLHAIVLDRDRMLGRGGSEELPMSLLVSIGSAPDSEPRELVVAKDAKVTAMAPIGANQVAIADELGRLRIWNTETGQQDGERQPSLAALTQLAYDSTRDVVLALDSNNALHRINTAPDAEPQLSTLNTFSVGEPAPRSIALSPAGDQLLIGRNNRLELVDAESGEPLLDFPGHISPVSKLAFDPAGERLASSSYDGSIIVWKVPEAVALQQLRGHVGWVNAVAFDPAGERLASAGRDGTLRLWPAGASEPELVIQAHTGSVTDLVFSDDGAQIITVSGDGTGAAFSPGDGSLGWRTELNAGVLYRTTISAGEVLVGANGLESLGLSDGTSERSFDSLGAPVVALASARSADGSELVAAGLADRYVQLLKPGDDGRLVRAGARFGPHAGRVQAVALNSDGSTLYCADGADVSAWSLATRERGQRFEGPGGPITSLAVSADGRLLAAGSESGAVRIWTL